MPRPQTLDRRAFLALTAPAFLAGAAHAAETAAPDPRPNVLLFFPDQHRPDWLPTTPGLDVRMPHFQTLCRRGVRFTNALCPSPLCAPSRACLAAGREYNRCGVPGNNRDYPLEQPTFYQRLRQSGYHVAGCGKFDLHKASATWGIDGRHLIAEWGFSDGIDSAGKWDAINSGAIEPKDPYMHYLRQRGLLEAHVEDFRRRRKEGRAAATFPTPLPDDAYCDNWIARNGLTLLERTPKCRPWFLQVNFNGPHDPLDITAHMEEGCRDRRLPPPNGNTQHPPEVHNAIRQNYTAMVENLDRLLGLYLDALEARGELDRTVVVWSSDHGEMLGDHNRWAKTLPWQPSAGVPLVIAAPGGRAGAVHEGPATTLDLAATFLDYAGVARPPDMDSRSLRGLLEGRTRTHREYALCGLGAWRLVFDGRYKLIRGFRPDAGAGAGKAKAARAEGNRETPPDILFDLTADPLEDTNVASRQPDVVRKMRGQLPHFILFD